MLIDFIQYQLRQFEEMAARIQAEPEKYITLIQSPIFTKLNG